MNTCAKFHPLKIIEKLDGQLIDNLGDKKLKVGLEGGHMRAELDDGSSPL